ncbi:MAG: hypothetical protein ACR2JQ_06440 [Mycobacteriales bacterium]
MTATPLGAATVTDRSVPAVAATVIGLPGAPEAGPETVSRGGGAAVVGAADDGGFVEVVGPAGAVEELADDEAADCEAVPAGGDVAADVGCGPPPVDVVHAAMPTTDTATTTAMTAIRPLRFDPAMPRPPAMRISGSIARHAGAPPAVTPPAGRNL